MTEPTYDLFLEQNPELGCVISRYEFETMLKTNDHTTGKMESLWLANVKSNLKKRYKKHGALVHDFRGFGANKAVIAVGAGPSFNLNKDVLKETYQSFIVPHKLKDQPFIIMASNHQFKPLLQMGIFPHFVLLVDAGDAVNDQLNKDIPQLGQNSILVASLQTSPKVLQNWEDQGRHICFFLPNQIPFKEIFNKRVKGQDVEEICIPQGGNVMNTAWLLSMKHLGSRVFMCVGNDLSFPYNPDYGVRRDGFYADREYQINIDNDRDEAKDRFAWMGFEFIDSILASRRSVINMKPVGTSRLLWIYKHWVEMHAAVWSKTNEFHYYNCSESGILGMLARDTRDEVMMEASNWFLLDEVIPKRWHTRRLKDAVVQFIEARAICQSRSEGILTGAKTAGVWHPGMVGARNTGLILPSRAI